jgi:hypothetical protein
MVGVANCGRALRLILTDNENDDKPYQQKGNRKG